MAAGSPEADQTEIPTYDPFLFRPDLTESWTNVGTRTIPGIFHAPGHVVKDLRNWGKITEDDAFDARVIARGEEFVSPQDIYNERQRRLHWLLGQSAATTELFFDEDSLTWPAFEPEILLADIQNIASFLESAPGNVTVGVLPSVSNKARAAKAQLPGPYDVMRFADDEPYYLVGNGFQPSVHLSLKSMIERSHETYREHTRQGLDILPLLDRAAAEVAERQQ